MSQSDTPLYGRAWELTILTDPSAGAQQEIVTYSVNEWEPEALRITFEIEQQMRWVWCADISIYNLNEATEQATITQGCEVRLSAGYQRGINYGLIFRGKLFQPMWEREGVVDYKVTLRCYAGLEFLQQNFVSMSGRFATQSAFVAQMAKAAHSPFQTDLISLNQLRGKQLPRGKGAFGSVEKYFGQIADDNDMQYWAAWDMPALGQLVNMAATTPDVIYAPPLPIGGTYTQNSDVTYSIVGTPQQTEQGVDFTVLLDARMILKKNPPLAVKLDMTQIRQLSITFGGSFIAPFEQSGTYYVAGVRHRGDSRGNDWYTQVTAVTPNALLTAAVGGA